MTPQEIEIHRRDLRQSYSELGQSISQGLGRLTEGHDADADVHLVNAMEAAEHLVDRIRRVMQSMAADDYNARHFGVRR